MHIWEDLKLEEYYLELISNLPAKDQQHLCQKQLEALYFMDYIDFCQNSKDIAAIKAQYRKQFKHLFRKAQSTPHLYLDIENLLHQISVDNISDPVTQQNIQLFSDHYLKGLSIDYICAHYHSGIMYKSELHRRIDKITSKIASHILGIEYDYPGIGAYMEKITSNLPRLTES